jgi:CO/xanthine dehydrogenase Mo-binding subunit
MSQCENKSIETIESLGDEETLHPLQQAFMEEGAVQCGFCTPGMLMAAKALLDQIPHPTEKEIRYALRNNLCRCTGYGAIIRAIQKAAIVLNGNYLQEKEEKAFRLIGKSVVKKDALKKVIGARVFAEDYDEKDCLHGQILFSKHAHAKILSIDTTKAETSEGVVKVTTYKDIKGRNQFGLFVPQQPVLCETEVKYLGDAIACVFATSKEFAKAASLLIEVEYEVLPALLDPEDNFKEGANKIHENTQNNIVHHVSVRKGSVLEGFEKADYIVENVYETQAVEHAYLEPESCFVKPTKEGLTIWTGSQGSEAYKKMIMETLALKEEQVRVVFTATGGGFGGKEEPTVQIHAALGAWLTKRPVKMVLTREESIRMSTKRHPMKLWMKHGVTKEGKIVAMTSKVIGDAGAYISQTNPVIFRSAVTASGPYEVETVEADSYGIYTHKNPSGAFRGFGSTQASFACESQMDQLAKGIGMSSYELRLKNAFKEGVVTSTGQVLKDGIGYIGTLKAAHEGLEKMKKEYMNVERAEHLKLGFGIASAYKNVGIGTGKPDKAGAYVEVLPSGKILVSMGATDMGQGVDTAMAQIAATALEMPYDLIEVVACDTATCPDGGMTTASRQTYVTGNAVKEASLLLKEKIERFVQGHEQQNDFADQQEVLASEVLASKESIKKLYARAKENNISLRIEHEYFPPKTYAHQTDANHQPGQDLATFDIHYSYCFASASVAVEVNTQTGEVHVLKVCAAQDVGKAIHPKNIIGQIEGSVAMGVGLALYEEFVVDAQKVHTDTLKKFKLLDSVSMPEVEAIIIEEEQVQGPYGAKGMGEVGLNPVAPAIANAIFDATGARLTSLPMKKEKVLNAIKAL